MAAEILLPGWAVRCAGLWERFDATDPAQFRKDMAELTGELPEGHPVAPFERASACDATDLAQEAMRHYRAAPAGGVDGERRRQAVSGARR